MIVQNMDLAGVIRRGRRFRYETAKAVSGNSADTSEKDIARAQSYVTAMRAYLGHATMAPQLDLPKSSPQDYDLGEPEDVPTPDNESLVDLIHLWDAFETEMGLSQSNRVATGLQEQDVERAIALLDKMDSLITYIQTIQPIDLPESMPLNPIVGQGR